MLNFPYTTCVVTSLGIRIYHRACSRPGCTICNRESLKAVAEQLREEGSQVASFSDDCNTGFGYIDVRERSSDCARQMR